MSVLLIFSTSCQADLQENVTNMTKYEFMLIGHKHHLTSLATLKGKSATCYWQVDDISSPTIAGWLT